MPVPATLTSYLPVLLVSVTNHAVPDDTSFSTQPEGQVDYLSHEWKEEDVWRSWRSMTRQKNAIANGMRLENASWRTWWKQRNKLKTISPETLNWLKDSDVTWLYGPLHTGSDWAKAPKHNPPPSPAAARRLSIGSGPPNRPRGPSPVCTKPILKRRSISQLLSLPASPFFHGEGSDSEDIDDPHHLLDDEEEPHRPPLLHTKSDTHISSRVRAFRKESPPRVVAADLHGPSAECTSAGGLTSGATSSNASSSTGSSQDLDGADGVGVVVAKKKHISFNTFVEQYIAIEKPKRKYSGPIFYSDPVYDEGYSEDDSEADNEDEEQHPSTAFYINDHGGIQSDSDEDDEDDVLEIKSRRSRSSSSSRSDHPTAMRTTSPPSSQSSRRPTLTRQGSIDREHMTIAPIAPTILKSTGVGNNLESIDENHSMRSQKEVELVYVPPSNSIYSLPGTPNVGSEDVYHHRESYFSVGAPVSGTASTSSPHLGSRSADSSPTLGTVGLPLHPPRQTSQSGNLNQFFAQGPVYDSPASFAQPHPQDVREDDYDYFGGPYSHEEYHPRTHMHHSRTNRRSKFERLDDDPGGHLDEHREHGVYMDEGTSSAGHTPMVRSPRIVVNEVAGATEEREETSVGEGEGEVGSPTVIQSQTQTQQQQQSQDVVPPSRKLDVRVDDIPLAVSHICNTPVAPVAVPRIVADGTGHSSPEGGSSYLSPTDGVFVIGGGGRGRSPGGCSPTSGSTTTGSYSLSSGASDSRSESRGRSSTRNSSSECDRSGSRSSRGGNSPLGSISPTGSGIGIGGGYGSYSKGRDREGRSTVVKASIRRGSSSDEGRGRDRTGRRIGGDSLSPPNMVGSPSRSVSDDFPAYSPVTQKTGLPPPPPSPSSSVCGSSVSGSSTASSATAKPGEGVDEESSVRGRPPLLVTQRSGMPSPIPEEEETRSRQPTPANSPVRAFSHHGHTGSASSVTSPSSHHAPSLPLHVTPPKSRPSAPETSQSEAQATPNSPTTSTRSPTSVSSSTKGVRSPERSSFSESHSHSHSHFDDHQHHQQGLVGRAAEIVSQARGFLGSIWSSSV
ncbi:hypothetical protein BDY19DRAFT_991222 [Irpex rosettiformis]|uniref:Uncharacterized protein n=1 Tax=Irpex rosettiformis TaxID=378272 RepID=A0ACB8UC29_9APHY|nr:hypothetical protein BDY19DRAFT_991222 [Irpex rosettiformis]